MTDQSTPIPPWAFPGNKVVCVRTPDAGYGDEIRPQAGQVYTIRGLLTRGGKTGLLLIEIVNRPQVYTEGLHEFAFLLRRFKPVATTDNEIEAQIYNRNSPRKSLSKKLTSA